MFGNQGVVGEDWFDTDTYVARVVFFFSSQVELRVFLLENNLESSGLRWIGARETWVPHR